MQVEQIYFEEKPLKRESSDQSISNAPPVVVIPQCLEPGRWLEDNSLEDILKFYINRDFPTCNIRLIPVAIANAWRNDDVLEDLDLLNLLQV